MNTLKKPHAPQQTPWWRVGMVWLVLAGPLSVMVASFFTIRLALTHVDPIVKDPVVQTQVAPGLTPAMNARNHAATPRP